MARGTRSPRTGNPGPGRLRKRRPRTSSPTSEPVVPDIVEAADRPEPTPVWVRSLKVTRRAAVLVLAVAVLLISFGGSVQIYLGQQHDMAVAEQEIRDRSAQIADLQAELSRWNDPAYIKAQARDRLGWVMPGEIGYRLVDADGNPIGGGVSLESTEQLPAGEHDPVWWDRLWGSIQTADSPARKVSQP